MLGPPTPRQLAVLTYLRDCLARSRVPPTRRELARHFRMTVSGIERHLYGLERRGMIGREPKRHRALYLLQCSTPETSSPQGACHEGVNQFADKMEKALDTLHQSIVGIRLGTVSPSLIDTFKVSYCGQQMPIKHLAHTTSERGLVLVRPFDPATLGTIRQTLSDAGFNAYMFSKEAVAVSVPMVCGEEIERVRARVRKLGEDAKVAIRNIRKLWRESLGRDGPDDQRRKEEATIQRTTDGAIAQVDQIVSDKVAKL